MYRIWWCIKSFALIIANYYILAYQEKFEQFSQLVEGLPEPILIGWFIGGFIDEICLEVKIQQSHSLSTTIGLARFVEEELNLNMKIPIASLSRTPPTNSTLSTFKYLTPNEMKEHKERGFCYSYNGKFSPNINVKILGCLWLKTHTFKMKKEEED